MIEKAIAYKNSDNEFIASLKKLGLSDKEIESILKKYKRKKFEGGGDGGGGDGGSGGGDGDGDGSSGDSSGEGDSGPGGSDDGTGHGGPGPGDAGVGMGEADTMGSSTAQDAAANQAASEAAAQAAADEATVGMQQNPAVEAQATTGIMNALTTLGNLARTAFNAYSTFSPLGIALSTLGNITRGVTPTNDYSQATTSVQTSAPATPTGGGGITTIQNYAPLTNTSTGDNTSDAIRTRLENLLKTQTVQVPTSQTVYQGQNINPLSNYTLLDLSNLRR